MKLCQPREIPSVLRLRWENSGQVSAMDELRLDLGRDTVRTFRGDWLSIWVNLGAVPATSAPQMGIKIQSDAIDGDDLDGAC